MKYGLPVRSPLDDGGIFTAEAGAQFEGKSVLGDGNTAVVAALHAAGALLKVSSCSQHALLLPAVSLPHLMPAYVGILSSEQGRVHS